MQHDAAAAAAVSALAGWPSSYRLLYANILYLILHSSYVYVRGA